MRSWRRLRLRFSVNAGGLLGLELGSRVGVQEAFGMHNLGNLGIAPEDMLSVCSSHLECAVGSAGSRFARI